MGDKAWPRNFEDFRGVDLRSTDLTVPTNYARSLKNYRYSEGLSLKGRCGSQVVGQALGQAASIHGYNFYNNNDTRYSSVESVDQLLVHGYWVWRVRRENFVITRTGGSATWNITVSLNAATNTYRLVLTQGGVAATLVHPITGASNAFLDLGTGLELTTNPSTSGVTTVLDVIQAIDNHANFSVPMPTKTARVNGDQASVRTINVDAGHTIIVTDLIAMFNTSLPLQYLRQHTITATAAGSITFGTLYPSITVKDNQVLGYGGAAGASIELGTTDGSSGTATLYYTTMEPLWHTTDHYAPETTPFSGYFLQAYKASSWVNAQDSAYLFTPVPNKNRFPGVFYEWEGYPFKWDGQKVYRSGLPKSYLYSTVDNGAGAMAAGVYRYKVRYSQYDKRGVYTSGTLSPETSVNQAVNRQVTVSYYPVQNCPQETIPISAVFANPVSKRFATVNGNQVATTLILVNSPHSLKSGDTITIADRSVGAVAIRLITTVTATSISITGAGIDVLNGDDIRAMGNLGYNLDGAVVNGNQAGVTTVTVLNSAIQPNRIRVGDVICLLDRGLTGTAANFPLVTRTITAVTATTIAWSPNEGSATVNNGDLISCNLRVEIYRTKANGNIFYLAHEVPNTSYNLNLFPFTSVLVDNKTDAQLGAQLLEPEIGKEHDPPPQCSFGCVHQGNIVYGGLTDDGGTLAVSDSVGGLETVPLASNYFTLPSNFAGNITAIISDNEQRLLAFKPNAIYDVSGNLEQGAISTKAIAEGDYGASCQKAVTKVKGLVYAVGKLGVVVIANGVVQPAAGLSTIPAYANNSSINPSAFIAFNDYINRDLIFYSPPTAPDSALFWSSGLSTALELTFAYNYEAGFIPFDQKFNVSVEPSMGFAIAKIIDGTPDSESRRFHLSQGYGGSNPAKEPGHVFREVYNHFYDNHASPEYDIELPFDIIENPSQDKVWNRLKIYSIPPSYDQSDYTPFTIRVTTYKNFQTSVIHTQEVKTFASLLDFYKKFILKASKAESLKLKIENIDATGARTKGESPLISGWQWLLSDSYKDEDMKKT